METIIIILFVLGYLAIAIEHNLKIDKLIPALIMMAALWAIVATSHLEVFEVNAELKELVPTDLHSILLHHLGKTAEILIFLMGAMAIVEIIDFFDGFGTIKNYIKTKNKRKLLWIFSVLAFILSAIIDNLTTTIVLITILQKVIKDRQLRLWFAGVIVIAANAGGAWSPIGDVTTTMLWIGNKVTTLALIEHVLIPSIVCVIVPTIFASRLAIFKGEIESENENTAVQGSTTKYGPIMLYLGLGFIIFVPIFKTVTHLPPYVGMMFSLAIVAIFAEIFSRRRFALTTLTQEDEKEVAYHSPLHHSLGRLEMPSILFFLGILMAVAALESLGMLFHFAETLSNSVPMLGTEPLGEKVSDLVIIILGFASAVIDNVPLVAASMGMFSIGVDDPVWHFIAYSAGTGGSMLIIGSAAGVVAMGMEKIDFIWYLKKIGWLAMLGFLSGSVAFILLRNLVLNA